MAKEEEARQRQMLQFLGSELTALKTMLNDESDRKGSSEEGAEKGTDRLHADFGKRKSRESQQAVNKGGDRNGQQHQHLPRRSSSANGDSSPIEPTTSRLSNDDTDWDVGRVKQAMNKLKSGIYLSIDEMKTLKISAAQAQKTIAGLNEKMDRMQESLNNERNVKLMTIKNEEENETKRGKEKEREESERREEERKEREKAIEEKLELQVNMSRFMSRN